MDLGCISAGHQVYSPRMRGCSVKMRSSWLSLIIFPAHAGVFRRAKRWALSFRSIPRAGGGVPLTEKAGSLDRTYSPRMRGWTRPRYSPNAHSRVFPAYAGGVPVPVAVDTQVLVYSPRMRGWAYRICSFTSRSFIFPAHAGVIPHPLWNFMVHT